ncbi:hypothetical protein LXA43DRAFT_878055 [Ganoderma leucocontextum]|nr:hypothetical protein LXA43DRAFT_878055 [Ganoderma leucocontextum]
MGADGRFADVNLKLYYVTENPDGHLVREELVRKSINNVLVETLPTGYFGLPESIVSTYEAGELGIHILHPSILILTKFKRWSTSYTSTRPKTIRKTASDHRDIRFIIDWLFEHRECIGFGDYVGKPKPELLSIIRKYHDKYVEDEDHIGHLRSIMADDWDDMLALPAPELEESTLPP